MKFNDGFSICNIFRSYKIICSRKIAFRNLEPLTFEIEMPHIAGAVLLQVRQIVKAFF